MDTINNAAGESLGVWWEAKTFPGKEFCTLDDNGALSIAPFTGRVISILNPHTGDAVLQVLQDKFRELHLKYMEVLKEWEEAADKLKLSARISRFKEQVYSANAIGDFSAMTGSLQEWERHIAAVVEENYQAKAALITTAEQLQVDNNNWKDITQQLKDISERWKAMGFVDKKRNEELWDRLEAVKKKFFEQKREHQDDIEKELLQNLDLKLEIVEKAEALAASENWKETTEALKKLLEEWKRTGRTIPEKNESLWQRFITASNAFFDRKKQHSDRIQAEQEANYALKLAIVEKAEMIKDSTDWGITAQAFTKLMDEWKGIGHIPAEYGNTLWQRFEGAKDVFYQAKRQHADAYRSMLNENYSRKMALIERAEAICKSNAWRETTDEMNRLFDDWKQVGHVGKEHSEALWSRFLTARKTFFNRKDEDRDRRKQQFERNKEAQHQQTRQFLENLLQETADEQEQIEEFRQNLANDTGGPKAEEIKKHLTNLIAELEQKIRNREQKIADLRQQLENQG